MKYNVHVHVVAVVFDSNAMQTQSLLQLYIVFMKYVYCHLKCQLLRTNVPLPKYQPASPHLYSLYVLVHVCVVVVLPMQQVLYPIT